MFTFLKLTLLVSLLVCLCGDWESGEKKKESWFSFSPQNGGRVLNIYLGLGRREKLDSIWPSSRSIAAVEIACMSERERISHLMFLGF